MSNRTIYKYPIYKEESLMNFNEAFAITMPKGAEILCVQIQHGTPQIWAIVNPDAEKEERKFLIAGTGWQGQSISKSRYVGTFQSPAFVWHLFEINSIPELLPSDEGELLEMK